RPRRPGQEGGQVRGGAAGRCARRGRGWPGRRPGGGSWPGWRSGVSTGSAPTLLAQVRSLLTQATQVYQETPAAAERLNAVLSRLDEPLRVAIAGKVKAGKSTLLNALVGEELAPTDAGECTKIVTWYRDG